MSELAEALGAAQGTYAMGAAIAAHASRAVGLSAFSFMRVSGSVLSPENVFAYSSRETGRALRERILGALPLIHRELQPFERFFGQSAKAFDIENRWPDEVLRRSEVFNGFWRPLALERQLVASLGDRAQPLGFICLARARPESPFTRSDLDGLERIRLVTERAVAAAAELGTGKLEETLDVLAKAEPAAWFLFDAAGDLLWLTEEATARLAVDVARVGSSLAIRHSTALQNLREWVRAQARRFVDGEPGSFPATGLEGPGETPTIRRFETRPGRSLFLVGFARPAMPERSEEERRARCARLARRVGLTPRQTEVLSAVAEGLANKDVAERLGCGAGNVEYHVTRLLATLGCRNRSQLVARVWAER